MIFRNILLLLGVLFCFLTPSCNTRHAVEVAPVEIKPIHITINVNVRVEKALDDFFRDIDEEEENIHKTP